MPALQARIADLEQELTVARAELTELERAGTPKEKLIRNACLAEKSVQGLASSLKVALVHDASMRTYGVGPSHLPNTATNILAIQFDLKLRKYYNGFDPLFRIQNSTDADIQQSVECTQTALAELSKIANESLPDRKILMNPIGPPSSHREPKWLSRC